MTGLVVGGYFALLVAAGFLGQFWPAAGDWISGAFAVLIVICIAYHVGKMKGV
jgi:hypothetical protein